jgi:hypothetical protein
MGGPALRSTRPDDWCHVPDMRTTNLASGQRRQFTVVMTYLLLVFKNSRGLVLLTNAHMAAQPLPLLTSCFPSHARPRTVRQHLCCLVKPREQPWQCDHPHCFILDVYRS